METLVEKHLDRWEHASSSGPVDVKDGALNLTLEVVTAALFGRGIDELPPHFHRNIDTIFEGLARRVENPLALPLFLPLPSHRKFLRAIRDADTVVYQLLDDRLSQPSGSNDLLARLIHSSQTTDGKLDRQALRNELVTYVFAGFETTATTLAWALYELARHPETLERLAADPSFATPVALETLRLHPPAWLLDFEAAENVTVGDVPIAKGQHVWLSQYLTHHRPDFWEAAPAFRPERFLPAASHGRHKYAFFPFGASARHCIGQGFAMQELEVALQALARRFRWTLADPTPVPEISGFVLRPGAPIRCRFERRSS